jgi:hypothetical protein
LTGVGVVAAGVVAGACEALLAARAERLVLEPFAERRTPAVTERSLRIELTSADRRRRVALSPAAGAGAAGA